MAYVNHILSQSPFYITEIGIQGFTSVLNIRIWRGLISAEPASVNYQIQKQAVSDIETRVIFEISKIIADFPSITGDEYTKNRSTSEVPYWVSVKSTGGTTNRNDLYIVTNGYTKYLDGINWTPDGSPLLLTEKSVYVPRSTATSAFNTLNVPLFYGQGSERLDTFRSFSNSGDFSQLFTISSSTTEAYNQIQHRGTGYYIGSIGGSNTGNFFVDYIEFYDGGILIDRLDIKYIDCSEHTPFPVLFQNKFGVLQQMYFFGSSKTSLNVKKDTYKTQVIYNQSGIPTYDTSAHQYSSYNSVGKETMTLNTGFIGSEQNETLSELMVSNKIWININEVPVPVLIKGGNLNYKTEIVDSMINYTIDFEMAFNVQNLVY